MNVKRKIMVFSAVVFLLIQIGSDSNAQTRPMYDLGSAGTALKLKRLQTTARVMLTAAHPDDEDTALIAYLARNRAASVVYYSVTRGDGGQNVIGDELSAALGVIRTEELLQARILDGGDQLFGSAIDYGFSKTLDEAKRMWPEQKQLSDMVRAIRLYRPHIIVGRFSGTDADGHGHHQMAGYLTPLAFAAAGREDAFPEHFKEGLMPWQPLKLYRGHGFMPDDTDENLLAINTGEFDGLFGRSYFEIAMQSRSRHRSQEMGAAELRGPQFSRIRLVESRVGEIKKESDIFDGIDMSLSGIAKNYGKTNANFAAKLEDLEKLAADAMKALNVFSPADILPILAKGHSLADELTKGDIDQSAKKTLIQKKGDFAEAMLAVAGVVIDPLSNTGVLNPGTSTLVSVNIFAHESGKTEFLETKIHVPKNWKITSADAPSQPAATGFRPRGEQPFKATHFNVTVNENEPATQPYWLELPMENANFNWTNAQNSKNLPFAEPLIQAEVVLRIAGETIRAKREVQHRFTDRIDGEIRRQLKVVPAVTLKLDADHLIIPVDENSQTRKVSVSILNNSTSEIKGILRPDLPDGWTSNPASIEISLKNFGGETNAAFDISPPANNKPGTFPIRFRVESAGKIFSLQKQEVNYPHINPHNLYSEASVKAQVINLKIRPQKVGYIMGSGDRLPDAIRRMGLEVEMLGQSHLSSGDLSQYGTIVVGVRASQTRADMAANNVRLLNYVENGGNLVVLYQQQEYIRFGLAPFPASMTVPPGRRPRVSNLRTTDETAEVKILDETHMLFNFPNKIIDSDWDGWVQERSLYCFTEFDDRYTPLLESHDDGEDENKGCMMYSQIGKGNYLYTSFSWFRQLPAGNPGAYRLFANILGMQKNE